MAFQFQDIDYINDTMESVTRKVEHNSKGDYGLGVGDVFLGTYSTLELLQSAHPTPATDNYARIDTTIYKYSGTQWEVFNGRIVPLATDYQDGIMSKDDKKKLDDIIKDVRKIRLEQILFNE